MALTPPVINRQPVGLLDFFGLKNGGQYPQQLSTVLAPTIDLLRLYEADVEEVISDGVAVAAGGAIGNWNFGGVTSFPGVVPQNELWHVLDFSIVAAVPANVTMFAMVPCVEMQRISPTVFGVGRASVQVGPEGRTPFEAAVKDAHSVRCFAGDFWMGPNSQLAGSTTFLTPLATAVPVVHNARLVRYRRS